MAAEAAALPFVPSHAVLEHLCWLIASSLSPRPGARVVPSAGSRSRHGLSIPPAARLSEGDVLWLCSWPFPRTLSSDVDAD